jgi:hypothetical protein
MSAASLADRERRVEVYSAILALLPAQPADVVNAIDTACVEADEVLRAKLLSAREITLRCDCPVGLFLLRPILTEPPSALGQLDLADPDVARHRLLVRNTAPDPSVCQI